jgi:hypothetical protein
MKIDSKQFGPNDSRMRVRSGLINSEDPLVVLLYLLMRDHIPSGDIEGILKDIQNEEYEFSNGWLANHAKDIAERLRVQSVQKEKSKPKRPRNRVIKG